MRKILLNLHIYAGLLCFAYLVIFGISSLNFNHPFAFTSGVSHVQWQEPVDLPDLPRISTDMPAAERAAAKSRANEQIRDALGLFGFQFSGNESYWKDSKTYHARFIRPVKQYEVDVHVDQRLAVVDETRAGVWEAIRRLHGYRGNLPASAFVSSWGWYTEFCTLAVLFSLASGVHLWTRRRNERRAGLLFLGAAAAFSLALIGYLTFHG